MVRIESIYENWGDKAAISLQSQEEGNEEIYWEEKKITTVRDKSGYNIREVEEGEVIGYAEVFSETYGQG